MGEIRTGRIDRTSKSMRRSHVWKVYPRRPGLLVTLCGCARAENDRVVDPGYDLPECARCRKVVDAAARVGASADFAV